jgi:hypothetical protein
VLDGILDNETELPIAEHTSDTVGYTDLVFGLFNLLGLQFSPRLRDLGDQQLYRIDTSIRYQNIGPLVRGIYQHTAYPRALGRSATRGGIAQARVGDRLALHSQTTILSAPKRANARSSRIWAPEQNDLHLALFAGRAVPTAHWSPNQQGRGFARVARIPLRCQ